MTFGSLFSGIGGIDLGLQRTGLECRWQVENDEFCNRVLAKHWPTVARYGDIRGVTGNELDRVDLICGGFPCPPVSVAGKRKGTADERWLWPEFARIVRVVGPRYVLVENVPGLLSANGGGAMAEVLGDLASLGYDAEWTLLRASDFGASHRRARVFIVAYSERAGLAGDIGSFMALGQPNARYIAGCAGSFFRMPGDKNDAPEPWLLRSVHGLPGRVDRITALGNAVVPQVAEWIGRRIMGAQ